MAFLLLFRLRELLSFSFSQVEVHGLRPAVVQLSFLVGVHLSSDASHEESNTVLNHLCGQGYNYFSYVDASLYSVAKCYAVSTKILY